MGLFTKSDQGHQGLYYLFKVFFTNIIVLHDKSGESEKKGPWLTSKNGPGTPTRDQGPPLPNFFHVFPPKNDTRFNDKKKWNGIIFQPKRRTRDPFFQEKISIPKNDDRDDHDRDDRND